MRPQLLFSTALITLLSTSWSSAQDPLDFVNPRTVATWGGVGGFAPFNYSGYGNGLTPGAAYLSGVSQVIRAQGEFNETTSRAYINYEEARKSYIANRKQWQQAYFAMRENNEAQRLRKLESAKHTSEALAYAARSSAPRPLSSESLDPITGRLAWPDVLQRPEFGRQREQIEQLFEIRASTSGAETNVAAIQQTVDQMVEVLRSEIEDLPVDQYMEARKFLDSLAWSARA